MTVRIIAHSALESLCASAADAVVVVDQNARICVFNPAAQAAFGVPAADLIGRRVDEPAALQPLLPLYNQAIAAREAVRSEITLAAGERCTVQFLVAPGGDSPPTPAAADADKTAGGLVATMRDIVHDLKVPIASAKSFIDLTGAFGELNERQAEFAARAQLSLASMLNTVIELLDMAWMESGGELQVGEVDLPGLVRHVLAQLVDYSHHRGVQIVLDMPEDGCVVPGDERRLQSAINNLVNNAIKYSPNGGTVEIRLQRDGDRAVFSVRDHGIGIAAEHLPRLFERFYRVRTPETRRIDGSGLGLAIVRTIVQKHGGDVFVESTPGEGSLFGFWVPLT